MLPGTAELAPETGFPMTPPEPTPSRRISPLLAVLLILTVVIAIPALTKLVTTPAALPAVDFWEYWAAGRLIAEGQNPYDPDQIHPVQLAAGLNQGEPVMCWNPPWSLPLFIPFGVLDGHLSKLLWVSLNLVLVLVCADWLWRFCGGPANQRWIAWGLAITFAPTVFVLMMGQVGPVMLLGAIGFLYCERQHYDYPAGAFGSLLAIKPQLFYLFALAILIWAISARRWRILVGGAVTLLAGSAIACAFNPNIFAQYVHALTHYPPSDFAPPLIGYMLRAAIAPELFWLQFVPVLAGIGIFAGYWLRQRNNWDWLKQLPIVLSISFITAPYGAWPFDAVVLLVVVIPLAARITQSANPSLSVAALTAFGVTSGVALVMNYLRAPEAWFIWLPPALFVGSIVLERRLWAYDTAAARANSTMVRTPKPVPPGSREGVSRSAHAGPAMSK